MTVCNATPLIWSDWKLSTTVIALVALLGAAAILPSESPAQVTSAVSQGTTRFVLDGNRMYAELGFIRPNGSIHRALAFVDMGSPDFTLTSNLFDETQAAQGNAVRFKLGNLTVEIPAAQVQRETGKPFSVNSDLLVEATLPASVLQRYVVVMDYAKRTLTLAQPGAIKSQGIPTPFVINETSGLLAVYGEVDHKQFSITIDSGSAYTWIRQSAAREWLAAHPDWQRGIGAVGPANMMMSGDTTETAGILMRIPEIPMGALLLKDIGALAPGPSHGIPGNLDLFDWYSQKNAEPVLGWIGGNVLKEFRLTIDYPNRILFWVKQNEPDARDLDTVGIILRATGREFFIAGIAAKNGSPAVVGVEPGDKVIRIGALETYTASWGQIYAALHGTAGDERRLTLERNGKRIAVTARVTRF